jgi:hypothetical protein
MKAFFRELLRRQWHLEKLVVTTAIREMLCLHRWHLETHNVTTASGVTITLAFKWCGKCGALRQVLVYDENKPNNRRWFLPSHPPSDMKPPALERYSGREGSPWDLTRHTTVGADHTPRSCNGAAH